MNRKFLKALVGVGAVGMTAVLAWAQPANDDCSMPTVLAIGANSGDTSGATGTDISSCAFNDALDVWFTFTAPTAGNYTFNTIGTTVDTVLSALDGCAGGEIICNDDGAGFPASLISLSLAANQVATIRLAGYNNTQGAYVINIIPPPPPPPNDTCPTAAAVTLPYNYSQEIGGASEDLDVSCNAAAAVTAQSGVWFSYTPASAQLVRFSETSASNVTISIFSGGCDGLSELRCSDPEDFVQSLAAGTPYHILVAAFAATPLGGGNVINFSMSEVQAPTNDTCATARAISGSPYFDTVDLSTAANDIDVGCNATANTEGRHGVWYQLAIGADPGQLILRDSSANDVFFSIFSGGCDGLTEVFCSDAEAPAPAFAAAANTTYYILVGMWSSTTVPAAPLSVQVDFVPASGSCCIGGNCTITTQSACTGTWGGVGSNCGGATGYNFVQGTNAYEDISGTGTLAATASACDDCGQTVPIGFAFNFLGNSYSDVWISSNGLIQFGGGNSASFTNAPIPTAATPNNFIAPLWDDHNPGTTGDVYYRLSGTPGSQTFTVSWQNVTQHTLGTNESFQVILTEGANGIEFRYGAITAETPSGDYTVGYESADGLSGNSVPGASLGTGGLSLTLSNANPCSSGGGDGACCSGANCTVTSQAACTGFGTSFTGSNTVCNTFGVNNLTPCCKADFNQVGGITVQDIFDFLNGYFTVSPQADVNGSGSVTVQDIFDYLSLYFVGGC
jgi:hypothetical protein